MENKDRSSDSATRLVVVLETNDQIQFALAKGLLEDAGIPLFIQGQLATLYQSVTGHIISPRCCHYNSQAVSQIRGGWLAAGSGSGIGYSSV